MKIDQAKHYFVPMHPLEGVLGGLVYFKSSNSQEMLVECEVVDISYGRITLRALDETYGMERYYLWDFEKLLEDGHVMDGKMG